MRQGEARFLRPNIQSEVRFTSASNGGRKRIDCVRRFKCEEYRRYKIIVERLFDLKSQNKIDITDSGNSTQNSTTDRNANYGRKSSIASSTTTPIKPNVTKPFLRPIFNSPGSIDSPIWIDIPEQTQTVEAAGGETRPNDLGGSFRNVSLTRSSTTMNSRSTSPNISEAQSQPLLDVRSVVESFHFNISSLKKPCCVKRTRRVFMTGVTGFIGRLQLATLLSSSSKITVFCLVRASSSTKAMERIINACQEAECWREEYKDRIIPILGDLTKSYFGLNIIDFKKLCTVIDTVYHNGADINLFKSYSRLRDINVLSLQWVIELCTSVQLKSIHYTSTLGLFPAYFASFQREYANMELTESSRPSEKDMQFFPAGRMGYPLSKWAGELILGQARTMGLPVTIYRLPVTCMTYETGYTHTDNVNIPVTAAALQEGVMPQGVIFTALSAADIICSLLVELSLTEGRSHWIYHLVDTRVVIRPQFVQWFRELGLELKSVSPDEYLNAIKARGSDSPLFEYIPMLQFWRKYWFADSERDEPLPISTRNILEDLPHRSSPWPPPREVFKRSFLYNLRTHYYKPNAEPLLRLEGAEAQLRSLLCLHGLEELPNSTFFLKPCNLLLDSVVGSKPTFAGRLLANQYLRQILQTAVYLEKVRQLYPQIDMKPINQPTFIVGLQQTSATLLQWLLAFDPFHRTPRYAEMAQPYGAEGTYRPYDLNTHCWNQDPRIKSAQDLLDAQLSLTNRSSTIGQLMRADLPFDDGVIFDQCGRGGALGSIKNGLKDNWSGTRTVCMHFTKHSFNISNGKNQEKGGFSTRRRT